MTPFCLHRATTTDGLSCPGEAGREGRMPTAAFRLPVPRPLDQPEFHAAAGSGYHPRRIYHGCYKIDDDILRSPKLTRGKSGLMPQDTEYKSTACYAVDFNAPGARYRSNLVDARRFPALPCSFFFSWPCTVAVH